MLVGALGSACAGVAVSTAADVWVTRVLGDTVRLHVLPDEGKVAALTSHVAGVTADEPLWAEDNVDLFLDTEAVAEDFRGRESPA